MLTLDTTVPLVSIDRLTRRYQEGERERLLFADLDLQIDRGEYVALMGRSGSGKSTLLNLISGIDLPDAGRIRIGSIELTALSERDRTLFRRAHIGFIYQFFNLIPTLTVEENVRLPLELNRGDVRRAQTLLAAVGLADRAASYPDRLSGGEQQRVGIARALVHQPSLVLADEPTGNLDADTAGAMLALLQQLVRETGTTLLVVTHDAAVARLADRVLHLEGGQIVAAARDRRS